MDQQLDLLQPFTSTDVKTVIFQIDSNKSPGPDGYGSASLKLPGM